MRALLGNVDKTDFLRPSHIFLVHTVAKGGQIRSVIIHLPNKQLVFRAIEIQATQSDNDNNECEVTSNEYVTSD